MRKFYFASVVASAVLAVAFSFTLSFAQDTDPCADITDPESRATMGCPPLAGDQPKIQVRDTDDAPAKPTPPPTPAAEPDTRDAEALLGAGGATESPAVTSQNEATAGDKNLLSCDPYGCDRHGATVVTRQSYSPGRIETDRIDTAVVARAAKLYQELRAAGKPAIVRVYGFADVIRYNGRHVPDNAALGLDRTMPIVRYLTNNGVPFDNIEQKMLNETVKGQRYTSIKVYVPTQAPAPAPAAVATSSGGGVGGGSVTNNITNNIAGGDWRVFIDAQIAWGFYPLPHESGWGKEDIEKYEQQKQDDFDRWEDFQSFDLLVGVELEKKGWLVRGGVGIGEAHVLTTDPAISREAQHNHVGFRTLGELGYRWKSGWIVMVGSQFAGLRPDQSLHSSEGAFTAPHFGVMYHVEVSQTIALRPYLRVGNLVHWYQETPGVSDTKMSWLSPHVSGGVELTF